MLYTQSAEQVVNLMKGAKEPNLFKFLSTYPSTKIGVAEFYAELNFDLDYNIPQRKLVDLGRIIAHVIMSQMIINLEAKGYNKTLASNALDMLKLDSQRLLVPLNSSLRKNVVIDYQEESNWRDFLK